MKPVKFATSCSKHQAVRRQWLSGMSGANEVAPYSTTPFILGHTDTHYFELMGQINTDIDATGFEIARTRSPVGDGLVF